MEKYTIESQITLHHRGGDTPFRVRIRHGFKQVESGWHADARDAYRFAESQLVIKPGYVDTPERV